MLVIFMSQNLGVGTYVQYQMQEPIEHRTVCAFILSERLFGNTVPHEPPKKGHWSLYIAICKSLIPWNVVSGAGTVVYMYILMLLHVYYNFVYLVSPQVYCCKVDLCWSLCQY